jgi:hypothetical protein
MLTLRFDRGRCVVAEKTILVCDVCDDPAVESAVLVVGSRRLKRDYCRTHLSELLGGWRPAGRGRGRPPGSRNKAKAPAAATRSGRRTRKASTRGNAGDVAAEVTKLKAQGMSYRQIGRALMEGGIKPPRAKSWNPVVLGRMVKRQSTA